MQAFQDSDELTFTSTMTDGRIIKIQLPPPCHALLGTYINECLPFLAKQN
jgi:hypothetical protein